MFKLPSPLSPIEKKKIMRIDSLWPVQGTGGRGLFECPFSPPPHPTPAYSYTFYPRYPFFILTQWLLCLGMLPLLMLVLQPVKQG